jgi:hypothetical protein
MDGATLGTFLASVPPPLTASLVALAPYISAVRYFAQAVSWKSSYYDAFLCLGVWWSTCLFSHHFLRYILPIPLVYMLGKRRRIVTIPAATERSLQKTIADLADIKDLRPQLPVLPQLSLQDIARVLAISYAPYLTLTYFVKLRVLIAITGTFIFTWRAPWAILIRSILWRNPLLRSLASLAWFRLTGTDQAPQFVLASQPEAASSQTRYLFTVFENQRWWVGLDWTAALLPNERPSWCSTTLQPVPPPIAFTLPETTSVILRDARGRLLKTRTVWQWEQDEEWNVLVKKSASSPQTRVTKPIPKDEAQNITAAGSVMSKVTARMKESSMAPTTSTEPNDPMDAGSVLSSYEDDEEEDSLEPVTDADGWVYGDNKWEKQTNKGGYNKYTRFRRWTRTALAKQFTEILEDAKAEPGVYQDCNQMSITRSKESASEILQRVHTQRSSDSYDCVDDVNSTPRGVRQRLKTALSSTSRTSLDGS